MSCPERIDGFLFICREFFVSRIRIWTNNNMCMVGIEIDKKKIFIVNIGIRVYRRLII